MMRGEVNFLHEVSRDAIEFVQAGGDIRPIRCCGLLFRWSSISPASGPAKREVRVALNEAIDREEVVKTRCAATASRRRAVLAVSLGLPARRFPVTFNPEAAKLRLDAAGFRCGGAREPCRRGSAFTCLVLAGDDRFERIALVVQRQFCRRRRHGPRRRRRSGGDGTRRWPRLRRLHLRDGDAAARSTGPACSGTPGLDVLRPRLFGRRPRARSHAAGRTNDEVRLAISDVMRSCGTIRRPSSWPAARSPRRRQVDRDSLRDRPGRVRHVWQPDGAARSRAAQ